MAVKFGWNEDETKFYNSLINLASIIGLALGCFFGGLIIPIGRRKTILIFNLLSIVGLSLSLILTFPTIIVGKLMFGITAGILSIACPKILDETIPLEHLGSYGNASNIFLCVGIGGALLIGFGLPDENDLEALENDQFWRVVYGFPIVVCVLLELALLFYLKTDSILFEI